MRLWRSLVRVVEVTPTAVTVVVPGWNVHEQVTLPAASVPVPVTPGARVHARVNLGADTKEELVFQEWEPR